MSRTENLVKLRRVLFEKCDRIEKQTETDMHAIKTDRQTRTITGRSNDYVFT